MQLQVQNSKARWRLGGATTSTSTAAGLVELVQLLLVLVSTAYIAMLLQSACSGGPEAARRARSVFCTVLVVY